MTISPQNIDLVTFLGTQDNKTKFNSIYQWAALFKNYLREYMLTKINEPTRMPVKYKLLLLSLSLVGTSIILASNSVYGIGLWPDAVKYIAVARNLISGNGFVLNHAIPGPLVDWPPLFPLFLAFFRFIFRVDPLMIAPVVNAVIFGLIVYLSGRLAFRCFPLHPGFVLLGATMALISVPLYNVSVLAASEPLFICFTLLAFLHASAFLRRGDSNSLLLFSFTVALASLTRYHGVTIIILGVIIVLLSPKKNVKTKIMHLLLFLFISILPLGVWLIRNYTVSGTLFGYRTSSIFSLGQNLSFTFNTFLNWYIPASLASHRSILILLSAVIGFLAGLNIKIIWGRAKVIPIEIILFVLFIIIYLAFVIITSTIVAADQISDRFLTPVYIPTALILLYLAEKLIEPFKEKFSQKTVTGFLTICFCLWLIYPISTITSTGIINITKGVEGYTDREWRESATIQYLLHSNISNKFAVYSNDPDSIYILTNLNAQWSPARNFPNSQYIINEIGQLRGVDNLQYKEPWPSGDKAYLVWFYSIDRDYLYTPTELTTIVKMEPLVILNDGVVYLITK